jgi:hypothetical protein
MGNRANPNLNERGALYVLRITGRGMSLSSCLTMVRGMGTCEKQQVESAIIQNRTGFACLNNANLTEDFAAQFGFRRRAVKRED